MGSRSGSDIETHIRRLERTRNRINLALESFRLLKERGSDSVVAETRGRQAENPPTWPGSSACAAEEHSPLERSAYYHLPLKEENEEEERFISLPVSFEATVKVYCICLP